ncbi:MAG: hypothetical protein A3J46_02945 [Candidatus Yanofskybacteria bacterium RIFCSPHIGHO2_02_FULL_41_11]|uniref:DUF58 domain-containing protein n=1 Tax=Candidatus Yanofskybacteria bacterium RIFCSPHIGHO2_02_FULL_41_11 TaxID=1802675 RepID=A0A1F8F673_9BACT|nr:MAG: hypothetical protein A3J46_02945 [Candidatus Yanofskybacteria bacterium RIFCSPHIGHO2_02_FULL_41_11]
MRFILNEVFSSIHKAANVLPISTPASRVRFGDHSSRFKGQGPDFYQISEYDPEEHIIDQIQWHLTDPNDGVYVREAKITKDFVVVVMADLSTSMMFGLDNPSKLRLLFETIGNIGLTCSHAQDPMGLIGFAENVIFDERPKVGEDSIYYTLEKLYKFFEGIENDGRGPLKRQGTNFTKALGFFSSRYVNKHCCLIVVSDFVGAEEFFTSQILRDVSSQHEVMFLFLDDPKEFNVTTWFGHWFKITFGYLRTTDMETERTKIILLRKMKEIGQEIRKSRKEMRNHLRDMGIDSMVLEYTTQGKHYERLYRFFLARQELFRS